MRSDNGTAFPTAPLAELCDGARGITYGIVKVGEFVRDGVPVIRGGDIRHSRIGIDENKLVTDEVSKQFKRTILRGGEIVLNLIAEPGHSAIVPSSLAGANVTRDVAVIPVTGADTRFVNYFLQSPQCISWLRAHLQGSVTLKINLGTLTALPVPVPTIGEQREISSVLGALDDRIENNRRIVKTLEEIAATLFKARFVDFVDHDDLVAAEGAGIPEGWSLVPIADLARYVNGKAFTKFGNGRGRMVIRIAELRSGPGGSTVYSDHGTEPDFTATPGDILFAWSGSLDAYRWYRPEALINQHIFKVIPDEYPAWFVFHALKHVMPRFQAIAADKATTMGHIKRGDLQTYSVAVPPAADMDAHDSVFAPLYERALAARVESETLAQIRDQLLPGLISGSLRVNQRGQVAA